MSRFAEIEDKVRAGIRLTEEEAIFLYKDADLFSLGALADFVNQQKNGKKVFYNLNRHINPTNICAMTCKFCAYSRKPGEEGGYEYSIEEMVGKAGEAVAAGATEVHMVGGLHPRWKYQHYLDMVGAVHSAYPQLHIKAFTAVEIAWLARKGRKSVEQVLLDLKQVGLGSLPGGGAEIFHQDVRDEICAKLTDQEWLNIHRTAHSLGMRSNCTMLYGHVEKIEHRVDHMRKLRDIQDEILWCAIATPGTIPTKLKVLRERVKRYFLPEKRKRPKEKTVRISKTRYPVRSKHS